MRDCSLAWHRVTVVCFSNTEGVGGDSPYNKAICPAGFAQFIDVCTVLATPTPVDFQGELSCVCVVSRHHDECLQELRLTLFGYGDDQNPYQETVDFLEDLVMEFITSMTQRAMEIGRPGKVHVEDIIFLVRKQPRMYARVRELLTMNEELKRARKAFDEIKYV